MKKLRITKRLSWTRTLSMGRATSFYDIGDYIVGRDISEEAARHAVDSNSGRYILSIEDRETKLAGLDGGNGSLHGDRPKSGKRAGRRRKKRKGQNDSDQRPGAVE